MVSIRIKFVPRDLWIGIYIGPEKYPMNGGCSRKIFVCIIPCFPIVIRYRYDR